MDEKSFAALLALKKQFSEQKGEGNTKAFEQPRKSDTSKDKTVNKSGIISKTKHVKNQSKNPSQSITNTKLINQSVNQPSKTKYLDIDNDDFKPRFDAKHSFNFPKWFSSGESLQHPSQKMGANRPILIRIGIDFGTAFTKVAVKVGSDTPFIIDWSDLTGQQDSNYRNLLPGIVARNSNGTYCWQNFGVNSLLTNLKLPLLNEYNNDNCPGPSIAYLAFVIRYSRAALYRHSELGSKLMQSDIRWELNIGCATQPFDNERVVKHLRKVALTAWFLAAESCVSDHTLAQAWEQQLELNGLECQPNVIPEFVAQIASYVSSPQLSEGLHMLIDVGAATLDIATFNIVQDRSNYDVTIPIFCSRVRKQGTHFLQLNRYKQLGLAPSWDDTLPIKSSVDFAQEVKLEQKFVNEADDSFSKLVINTIKEVIMATKQSSMAVPESAAWSNGLPAFVTGGGSTHPLYTKALKQVEVGFRQTYPKHNKFRLIPYNSYTYTNIDRQLQDGRLSVAYGLTEDAESIARIVPTHKIVAIERGIKKNNDHSEIYPK